MDRAHSLSLIRLDSIGSTNTYLAGLEIDNLPHGTIVSTREQTAGRGQRGNTWEAEPGKNLTLSMLLRPRNILPRNQFVISEIVSVAIVLMLRKYVSNHEVSIKWPNDIYVDDSKICGILIEHTLTAGRIDHTIAGIGLNINQLQFESDAPNPVSIAQLTGSEYDLDEMLEQLGCDIMELMERYDNPANFSELHQIYLSMLWRRGIPARYRDTATGREFEATLTDVAPDGYLQLLADNNCTSSYAFKEVAFIL